MKKPPDIQGLAERLKGAAATPVGAVEPVAIATVPLEPLKPRVKAQKPVTVPVFLRLPQELFAKIDAEAVNRTKSSGRGVTVQQVIAEKLEGAL
jgi:hypothetical protein